MYSDKPRMLTQEEYAMATDEGIVNHYGLNIFPSDSGSDSGVKFFMKDIVKNRNSHLQNKKYVSWYDVHKAWYDIYFSKLWKVLE